MYKKLLLIMIPFILMFQPVFALYFSNSDDLLNTQREFISFEDDDVTISYNDQTNYIVEIMDLSHLLSDYEKDKLIDEMMPLTEYGHVIFLSIDYNSMSATNFAEHFYHESFGNSSGSLLLIDMDTRDMCLFSEGNNSKVITDSKAYSVTDNTYTYASKNEFYLCVSKTFSQVHTLLNGDKIIEPLRYANNLFISIVISFFLTFMFVLWKTKIKKAPLEEQLNQCNISFDKGPVTAEKTGTRKINIQTYSGSSYSRSGSSSSGSSSYSSSSHSSSSSSSSSHSGSSGHHRF